LTGTKVQVRDLSSGPGYLARVIISARYGTLFGGLKSLEDRPGRYR
jgi:hypothetical protein